MDETDECVLTPYVQKASGYGVWAADGQKFRAHVESCTVHHGPRPEGMDALHKCGVRNCINGRHLYWGDDFDNVADRRHHERHGHGTLRAETSP
jgi:hypothetical protein